MLRRVLKIKCYKIAVGMHPNYGVSGFYFLINIKTILKFYSM